MPRTPRRPHPLTSSHSTQAHCELAIDLPFEQSLPPLGHPHALSGLGSATSLQILASCTSTAYLGQTHFVLERSRGGLGSLSACLPVYLALIRVSLASGHAVTSAARCSLGILPPSCPSAQRRTPARLPDSHDSLLPLASRPLQSSLAPKPSIKVQWRPLLTGACLLTCTCTARLPTSFD